MERRKQAGAKRAATLPVSAPFHCKLMQPAQESLARDLAELEFRDPAFPVEANASAKSITTGGCRARGAGGSGDRGGALGAGASDPSAAQGVTANHRGGAGTRAERLSRGYSGQGRCAGAQCGGFGLAGEDVGGACRRTDFYCSCILKCNSHGTRRILLADFK